MYTLEKQYYMKHGRLDLSILDGDVSQGIEEELKTPEGPKIYKDAQIESVLKEMGDFFGGE
ncbi:MAG: hypothetical protein ACRCWY_02735 [Cellulosilyticaceae bacterium]